MIAGKHFDPILGVDIHLIQPPGPVPPVPVPHPVVGLAIDLMEYAPYIGGTVKVNGTMRGVAGTGGKNLPPHIPLGGVFVPPVPGNECTVFTGSQTVGFDSDPASRLGDMVLSCQSVGLPAPPRPKPHTKPKSQYLPMSVLLAIPAGPPVLVGGPPTITVMGALKVLGPFVRWVQQASKWSGKFEAASQKAMAWVARKLGPKSGWLANKFICFLTGHPVDVASGQVLTEAVDVELPGPLPFRLERTWYSRSGHRGPLGHGWHHSFDLALTAYPEGLIARLADGRPAAFESPSPGVPAFNRPEKLFLHATEYGYELENLDGLVHHFGHAEPGGPEVPLAHVRDANGNRIHLERERGRLVAFIDSGGRRLPVTTDAAGRVEEIRGPDPERSGETVPLVSYRYTRAGDLAEVRDALGNPFRYEYAGHQLLRETDRDGLSFYFMYDSDGLAAKCIRTWGDDDVFLRDLTYDDDRQRTVVIDSLGHETVAEWNDLGAVTRILDPLGGETLTEWSRYGDKLSETDPAGGTTSFEYDDFGRVVSVTDPCGASVATKYDAAGNAVAFTDPGGRVWRREYDSRRNVVAIVDPLGHRRAFTVDARGLPLTATDPLGHRATFAWTAAGQLAEAGDFAGGRTVIEYDRLGRAVKRTDALGHVVRMRHDRRGLPTEFTDESGAVTALSYNAAGNLSESTDPLGRVSRFTYAVMGRVAEARTPGGRVTRYRYDAEGRLVEARDPAGRAWQFVRDALGRVTEETTSDGRTLGYQYGPAGFVTESTNARGQVTKYRRDAVGRLLKRAHADGSANVFQYAPGGLVVGASNADAEVKLRYDACGRVVEETLNGRVVGSTYDAAGNRTARVSPLGRTLHFRHDPGGRLLAIADGDAPLIASIYDALGRETARRAGGTTWEWDYRPTGELAAVTARGRVERSRHYESNRAGEPTAQRDTAFSRTEYAHDADGYLTAVSHADGTGQTYDYDLGGDIRPPAGVTVRRDADGRTVAKATADATWDYDYDSLGQLRRARSAGGVDVAFAYDPFGRRVRKTVGAAATEFVWDGDIALGELGANAAEYLFRPGTFEPLAVFRGDRAAVLDCDPVGLPRAAWGLDGEPAWAAAFAPFGELRGELGEVGLVTLRYLGQSADAETGLVYNRFRYLDPEQRAYLTPEPLGLFGNDGVWQYVPSPVAWADPYGLSARGCEAGGGFARGIAANEISDINRGLGGTNAFRAVETALANASNREGFWNKTATIVRDIAGAHLFNDANKRTAQALAEELVRRNGVTTGVGREAMKSVIGQVARGELREVDVIAKALRGF